MSLHKAIIFTAPSGAGKTTIVRHLLRTNERFAFSISATTRTKRRHEKQGIDYYFLKEEEFKKKVEKGDFLEWEEVYPGLFYGTLYSEIDRLWSEGKHILFDVDVKGALDLKAQLGKKALAIFVRPPSLEVLYHRLQNRGTESEENLLNRKEKARYELSFADRFDKILINDILEVTLKEAESIVAEFIEDKGLK